MIARLVKPLLWSNAFVWMFTVVIGPEPLEIAIAGISLLAAILYRPAPRGRAK